MQSRFRCIPILFCLAILCAGCIKGPASSHFDPLYDKFGEITLADSHTGHATYMFDGFSVRWDKGPHRLNKLAAGMMLVENDKDSERATALGRIAFRGGAWSVKDAYDYSLGYTLVRSRRVHFYHGEVADIEIKEGQGEREVRVNLGQHGMALFPKDQVAVFLRGFYFNTDKSHASGFPVRKIAVEIRNPHIDNRGHLTFTAHMELKAGPRNLYMHYEGENLVIGKMFYTVASTRYGILTAQDHEYKLSGAQPENGENTAVTIQGAPGNYGVAFVGMSRFSLDWHDSAFLIRGIRVRNSSFDYDPATGRMQFIHDSIMDNSPQKGLLKSDFVNGGRAAASFVLMQVSDQNGRVSHGAFDGKAKDAFVEHSALSFSRTFSSSPPPPPEPEPEIVPEAQPEPGTATDTQAAPAQ